MIVIPSIDLAGGECAQLAAGSYEHQAVRISDPVGVARSWGAYGFNCLHVVDLDASAGRASNEDAVQDILREPLEVQVGGGVRSGETIERLLRQGATRVVIGSRALEEPDWLEEMASLFPDALIVAADVRDRRVATRGWSRTLPLHVLDVMEELNELALAGVMVTATHREGQLGGTDLLLMEDLADLSQFPVYASGGIATLADLRSLEDRGVAAAIIGIALYNGALDPRVVAEEFAE